MKLKPMSKKKLIPFAVTVRVKPKSNYPVTYKGATYNGISIAKNAADAKEQVIQQMVHSIKNPVITKDECLIKACIPYDDFIVTSKTESEDIEASK
jgi:hypothetical protein